MEWEPDLFGYAPPKHASGLPVHRSYFALLPPPNLAQEIESRAIRWGRARGVRRVQSANQLHVSLNGIQVGETLEPDTLEDALAIGEAIRRPGFDMVFDTLETWGGKPREGDSRALPTVLHCSSTPRGLIELYDDLWRQMGRFGLRRGKRDCSPHITLWYDHSRIEAYHLPRPIRFRADHFWLVHSILGARRLEHLASWRLKF